MGEEQKPLIELIQFTDPYCTWCWGWEPVARRIEEVYGGQVRLSFVLGGLVEDASVFQDPLNHIGGPDMAAQVAEHWQEASRRHGMPVDGSVWLDMKDEFVSTYPASISYKAAQMQDRQKADRFLRRLRQAAAAEHKFIHRREVQSELAEEVGLDHERLILDMDSGAAGEAFRLDLKESRSRNVTGFPSFSIRNRAGEEIMFFGFQPFSRFEQLFKRLAGDELKPRQPAASEESITDFIRRNGKVAGREVGEVFSLNASQTEDWLSRLQRRGLVSRQKAGNGWFYSATV